MAAQGPPLCSKGPTSLAELKKHHHYYSLLPLSFDGDFPRLWIACDATRYEKFCAIRAFAHLTPISVSYLWWAPTSYQRLVTPLDTKIIFLGVSLCDAGAPFVRIPGYGSHPPPPPLKNTLKKKVLRFEKTYSTLASGGGELYVLLIFTKHSDWVHGKLQTKAKKEPLRRLIVSRQILFYHNRRMGK